MAADERTEGSGATRLADRAEVREGAVAGAPARTVAARPDSPSGSGPPLSRPDTGGRWGLPLAVIISGMFMVLLDTSIVNVAVPSIQKQFGTSVEDIQWIATAYTLCLGIVVPASSWLGERIGLKRIFLISVIGFALASGLCGLSWSLSSMIFFRVLQAIPGGVIPVTCLTAVYRIVPSRSIGLAMGLYGLGVVAAPAIGPSLGGYLVQYTDWRLIFFINVPVGLVAVLAAIAVLPHFEREPPRPFDLPGFLTIGIGLTALLLAMSEGQDWGWTGYRVLTLVAVGVNCLALFVVVELQRAEPLLDVRVFRHPRFANALFLIMIVSISLFVTLYYIPLFLQDGQNLGAFDTGLVIVPQALVMLVMMPLAGRLYDLVGARIPAVVGMALNGIGTLLMCDINADVTHGQLIWWTIVRGFGMSLSTMPIMTGGIGMLPPEQVGLGSTFNNVILRAAPAFGLAALTAIVTRDQTQHLAEQSSLLVGFGPTEDPRILAWQHSGPTGLVPLFQRLSLEAMAHSYSTAFLVMGLLCLVGAALALLLPHGAPTRSTSTGPVEL